MASSPLSKPWHYKVLYHPYDAIQEINSILNPHIPSLEQSRNITENLMLGDLCMVFRWRWPTSYTRVNPLSPGGGTEYANSGGDYSLSINLSYNDLEYLDTEKRLARAVEIVKQNLDMYKADIVQKISNKYFLNQ